MAFMVSEREGKCGVSHGSPDNRASHRRRRIRAFGADDSEQRHRCLPCLVFNARDADRRIDDFSMDCHQVSHPPPCHHGAVRARVVLRTTGSLLTTLHLSRHPLPLRPRRPATPGELLVALLVSPRHQCPHRSRHPPLPPSAIPYLRQCWDAVYGAPREGKVSRLHHDVSPPRLRRAHRVHQDHGICARHPQARASDVEEVSRQEAC
mmetsp:Transcript_37538/g.69177  ORF Transcript_37538/g.69177 Transcript_37538/m.69177 type:complete len:207 (+) Transcript_37538:337-957(+)